MPRKIPAVLCPELNEILLMELKSGNSLVEPPAQADWPEKGAVFAALVNDLSSNTKEFSSSIVHSISTDPHYGWHNECFCKIHKHLLVAGKTKHPGWDQYLILELTPKVIQMVVDEVHIVRWKKKKSPNEVIS